MKTLKQKHKEIREGINVIRKRNGQKPIVDPPRSKLVKITRMSRVRKIASLADIIQSEVGFINGWSVEESTERAACEIAASRILDRIGRWKRHEP